MRKRPSPETDPRMIIWNEVMQRALDKLLDAGMPIRAIADELGVDAGSVVRRMKATGCWVEIKRVVHRDPALGELPPPQLRSRDRDGTTMDYRQRARDGRRVTKQPATA